jgi:glycosyltransferase involved in cell wall biosynthesis
MFVKPALNIVATILAKNEEDILARNIEHHIEQGITQFVITDNKSTDRTREIAESYPEVKNVIYEISDDHDQSKWVTRMARWACRLKPDWIVHLDADELWEGFGHLREMNDHKVVGCEKMYLHPPSEDMSYYLDFGPCGLPEECKVIHRPDPTIEITHGNHAVVGAKTEYTKKISRHHFPIRSIEQFERKAMGHLALLKRGSICERWKMWYEAKEEGKLEEVYHELMEAWDEMIGNPNHTSLCAMLKHWSTPNVVKLFEEGNTLPLIGKW